VVPENIHTPPQRLTGNFKGEGVLKAKECMSLNWNFQKGGVQTKKLSVG